MSNYNYESKCIVNDYEIRSDVVNEQLFESKNNVIVEYKVIVILRQTSTSFEKLLSFHFDNFVVVDAVGNFGNGWAIEELFF